MDVFKIYVGGLIPQTDVSDLILEEVNSVLISSRRLDLYADHSIMSIEK